MSPWIVTLFLVAQQPAAKVSPWEQRLIAIEKRMDGLESFGRQARIEGQAIIDASKLVQSAQRERMEIIERKLADVSEAPATSAVTSDDIARLATPDDVKRVVDAIAKPGGPDWTVIGTILGGVLITVGNSYLNRRAVRRRIDELAEPAIVREPVSHNISLRP